MKVIFLNAFKLISSIYELLLEKIIWRMMGSTLSIKVLDGHKYKFKKYGHVTKLMFAKRHLIGLKRSFEFKTLSLYSSLINEGDVVFDIGANVGLFSLMGNTLVGDKGKIHAFEPNDETYQVLCDNLKINKVSSVVTHKLALSDTEERVVLRSPETVNKRNIGESDKDAFFYIEKIETENENSLQAKTLDTFMIENSISKVNLIKIDIEGAEYLCLNGAKKLLSSSDKPTIIFECTEPWCRRFNYTIADLLAYLKQYDYHIENYDKQQWIATYKQSTN